ncbi:hypothetical protein JOM56_011083 [Amanita muscaria]
MADIDVQTAQLIIQLARDDFYQLGDDAQDGGLLSDLEFALVAQEREFMQRWRDYGDVQFHPGARSGGGRTGDNTRILGNQGNDGPSHATNAGLNVSTSANRPTPSHPRVAVPEPRAHNQSDEEDSDSDLSPIPAVVSNDVRPALSNISVPSSSNSATRNPVPRVAPSPKLVEEPSDDEDTSSVLEFETGPSTVVECYFCKEDCPISTTILTSCYHRLCQTCITRQIEVCIQDERTYPPKCCGNKLQINELHLTDRNLHQRYELKVHEYDTPAPSRVYCYRCSRFLSSSFATIASYSSDGDLERNTKLCSTCSSWTCINCKLADHPGKACQETAEDRVFKLLTKQKGWQTCPTCKAVVERNGGCNHMICRCTAQFCYHCATRWKQCTC